MREINEDSYAVLHGNETCGSLAVVCDGMGGVVGGKISPNEAFGHPSGHLLMQAVGASTHLSRIQSQVDDLAAGDVFLICSDGLSDLVHDDEIKDVFLAKSFTQVCGDLVGCALQKGGSDNITVIVAEVTDAAMQRKAG